MYLNTLEELISLLLKSNNEHWADWFNEVKKLYEQGEKSKSYAKALGAYGGMGSFNDVFWDLPKKEFDRLEFLKGQIWNYAKKHS
ncbi:hypothetical protein MO867_17730 [Microbulbifer sp. OS29]|uniref:DUF6966 domain-containing protein n=1 Tax=Microbulbifer okhotskensis TaxID=2926617 RepID=A0A9X2EQY9_9GAMM|nr:hypothetical protein [Microbulbifer okhotskensis]MCO1336175.1 hypothetical protein [Microbulbifer okhotskensis]